MSITTYGWGSSSISCWGWGGGMAGVIPVTPADLFAQYVGRAAYTCVITRDYLEVIYREKDEIVLRVKLDDLSERVWDVLLERAKPQSIPIRERGALIRREEETLLPREKSSLLLRSKPDSMPGRVWQTLLSRAEPVEDVAIRSEGWPDGEVCISFDPYK